MNATQIGMSRRGQWAVRAVFAFGLFACLFITTGCSNMGDIITYAGDARLKGMQLYNEGNYPDAAGSFTNAIRQDPRDYTSFYYLGRSYEAMKDYHQAVQAYRTSLDVMSQSMAGGQDASMRLKVVDAIAGAAAAGNDRALERAALHSPDQPTAEDQFILAKIYRAHGDVDTALETFSNASLLEPNNASYAKEFGLYLVQLGQNQKAATPLKRAYVLNRRQGQPEDGQVVAGLRQVGVVPGPSLGEERDLVQPPIPRGPIPEVDVNKIGSAFTGSDSGQAGAR